MAAYTFAALFLAHVLADYVLQTTWMVINKRCTLAMVLHIGLVFVAMCLTTLSIHSWFFALALAHLWIDVVKTYAMSEGILAYIADQVLHVGSIIAVALLAPGIWPASPLSEIAALPFYYMIAGGVLFAMRGGQYAVAMLVAGSPGGSGHGVVLGWAERAALCVVLIGGWPWLALGVVAAKGLYLALSLPGRAPEARARLWIGTAVSFGWGLAVAVPMTLIMPMMT